MTNQLKVLCLQFIVTWNTFTSCFRVRARVKKRRWDGFLIVSSSLLLHDNNDKHSSHGSICFTTPWRPYVILLFYIAILSRFFVSSFARFVNFIGRPFSTMSSSFLSFTNLATFCRNWSWILFAESQLHAKICCSSCNTSLLWVISSIAIELYHVWRW